jgi:hypothetical protein
MSRGCRRSSRRRRPDEVVPGAGVGQAEAVSCQRATNYGHIMWWSDLHDSSAICANDVLAHSREAKPHVIKALPSP